MADPPGISELAAEAANALRGHLQFLASMGVGGLPATRLLRVPAPPPAPTTSARVAPQQTDASPWERHAPARAPAPATTTLKPPPKPPAVPPLPAALRPSSPAPPAAPPPPMAALPDTPGPRGAEGLRLVREDMVDCRRCKLHAGRTNIVFGVGSAAAEICFVGEGPGADEDMQGEPFVGRAGQLLTQMIKAMGFAREDVYICNVVKCRPPNNRDPEGDESAACSPFLVRQLRAIRPKVIVTLGKHAAHALLGVKTPITRLRGTWGTFDGIPLMPTFHPSYLLRDPTQKRFAWDDLKSVLAHLGRPVPPVRKNA